MNCYTICGAIALALTLLTTPAHADCRTSTNPLMYWCSDDDSRGTVTILPNPPPRMALEEYAIEATLQLLQIPVLLPYPIVTALVTLSRNAPRGR